MYVGSRTPRGRPARAEEINVYRMDPATGGWTHVQKLGDLENPSFLALDSKRSVLYAAHGYLDGVSAFRIDPGSGRLTFLNRQSTKGKNPAHLTVDPTDRCIVTANYGAGAVAVLPIESDGSVGPVSDIAQLPGEPGPHKTQQMSSHPHHVVIDRSGRFVVVPDKGLDKVHVFRLDAGRGKLVPNDPPSVASRKGAAPRHVDFHPRKPYAYVMNELDSTIATYRIDENGGLEPVQVITTLPTNHTGNNTGAEIWVAPSGRFVYSSNRGHDSIAIFGVDDASCTLTSVGWESTRGRGPRFFALDPSGAFLYAANEFSDDIVAFRIDEDTGKLEATGHTVPHQTPTCIVFAETRATAATPP